MGAAATFVVMDSDLLRQAKAGDSAALNSVWCWCVAELQALYRSRVSRETAEVLVQRSAIDLLKKIDQAPDDPGEFRSWLRGFGRKVELRWRREVARYGEILAEFEDQGATPARGLESQFGMEEERALMDSAIKKLRSPYRSTLRLHNKRLDAHEIATKLEIAEGTVRWRLMVARQELERLIGIARVTKTPYRAPKIAS